MFLSPLNSHSSGSSSRPPSPERHLTFPTAVQSIWRLYEKKKFGTNFDDFPSPSSSHLFVSCCFPVKSVCYLWNPTLSSSKHKIPYVEAYSSKLLKIPRCTIYNRVGLLRFRVLVVSFSGVGGGGSEAEQSERNYPQINSPRRRHVPCCDEE